MSSNIEAAMNLKVTRALGTNYVVESDCGRVLAKVVWIGDAGKSTFADVTGKGATRCREEILECVREWVKDHQQPTDQGPVLKVRRDLVNTNMFHVSGEGVAADVEVVAGQSKDFVKVTGKGANTHKDAIIDIVIHYMQAADGVMPDDARAVVWEARKAAVEELRSLEAYESHNTFVMLTVCHKIEMLRQQIEEMDNKLSAPRLDFYKGTIDVSPEEQYRVHYKVEGRPDMCLVTDATAELAYAKERRELIAFGREVTDSVVVKETITRQIVDWDREAKHEA